MKKIVILAFVSVFWLSSCISADTEIVIDTDFWVVETAVIDMSEFASIMLSMWSSIEDIPTCTSLIEEFENNDNAYNADRMDCIDLWNYTFETVVTWWNILHIVKQTPWRYEINLSSLTWETSDELDEMGESFLESMTLDTRYVFPYNIEKTDFGTIWDDRRTLILNIDDYITLWNNDFIVTLIKDSNIEKDNRHENKVKYTNTFSIKEYILTRNQVINRYTESFISGLNLWLEQMSIIQRQQTLENISRLPDEIKTQHQHSILIQYIELHIQYLNL